MYVLLLTVLAISIGILMIEACYVANHITTKVHVYLLFYILCCLVNNVGYTMEMTAESSEAFYTATRLLYLGKMNIAFVFFVFILLFCKVKVSRALPILLFVLHQVLYGVVLTNDWHHLYYTTITYEEDGLFPHNVYGHGPVYNFAMILPYVYMVITFVIFFKTYRNLRTKEEKKQMVFLIIAPLTSLLGTLAFLTGKTAGFDTGNIGIIICAIFMFLSLFKYKLVDTVELVKDTVADSLEDGLIAIDINDNLAYANEKAKYLFPGIKKPSSANTRELIGTLVDKAKNSEIIKSEERSYEVRVQYLFQGSLYRGRIFVLDDVTENLKYTERLEEERDRADQANEAKSQFLSNMSHEIRTPMNAVVGMTDIMLQNNPSEQDAAYLEIIKSSGNALIDIINDILDFSKIESGKMEIIDSEYSFDSMLNDLKVIFNTRIGEKPIRMIYEIDEKLPAVLLGDSVRIRQILINIINNAIKFTDKGFVKLKVLVDKKDADTAVLKISVQDSGQGIKEEDLGKLFESFSQVNAQKNHSKEGTGLGLAISRQLIELMGGSIGVESVYGEGTTFFFNIPQKIIDATYANDAVVKTDTKEEMTFSASKAQVLLVDDSPINLKVAKGLLKPVKLNIDTAENGLDAIEKIKGKEYDIIFMDHMMPEMDGIEATKIIREIKGEYYERVPIIALTANAVAGAKEEYLEAGMNDFVSKPIKVAEILKVLKKWLPEELID